MFGFRSFATQSSGGSGASIFVHYYSVQRSVFAQYSIDAHKTSPYIHKVHCSVMLIRIVILFSIFVKVTQGGKGDFRSGLEH